MANNKTVQNARIPSEFSKVIDVFAQDGKTLRQQITVQKNRWEMNGKTGANITLMRQTLGQNSKYSRIDIPLDSIDDVIDVIKEALSSN